VGVWYGGGKWLEGEPVPTEGKAASTGRDPRLAGAGGQCMVQPCHAGAPR
jgi:hypothetical protein